MKFHRVRVPEGAVSKKKVEKAYDMMFYKLLKERP